RTGKGNEQIQYLKTAMKEENKNKQSLSKENLACLVALSSFSKFGPKSLLKIKRTFVNLQDLWQVSLAELLKLGIEEQTALSFLEERKNLHPEQEWLRLEKEKIKVVSLDDELYPALLKEIYYPPVLLYYKGTLVKDAFPLAVVGSRHLGPYGKQVIEKLIPGLVQNNISIVSGLALGADAYAHQECLKNKGRTLAVLGSGLNKESIYPKQNVRLAEEIIDQGGTVMTEFPLNTLPLRYNFPLRNRIISGLSFGTLVIEATEESGSLITAKLALEQNREVFCVPGSVFSPLSVGPNNLLKLGAKTVTCFEDILAELDIKQLILPLKNSPIIPSNSNEKVVLKTLSQEPKHIDKITQESGLTGALATAVLSIMEISGKVKNVGGMNYIIKG
ncbi:MAG: DNA-processing protein DprA, partial [Candidatus Magasanikbacteria bacterium]|nr:DNA-processing protein DprA [Candidatus Magasanikbacteria bacterium]